MTAITRSIYGADLQSSEYINKPYVPEAKTTVNERFNIHYNKIPSAGELHALQYFCIGNKGHYATVSGDGFTNVAFYKHKPQDAGLYNFIPFVVRPELEDLSTSERLQYGMRVPITVGSGPSAAVYWAYYFKKLDTNSLTPQKKIKTTVGGVSSYAPFEADEANLTPIPEIPSNSQVNTSDGTSYEVVTSLDVSINALDAEEIRNACQIIYGDASRAVISEIGVVSAVRKSVEVLDKNLANTAGTYFEAIRAIITDFVSTHHSLVESSNGIDLKLNLGASEPLQGTAVVSGI